MLTRRRSSLSSDGRRRHESVSALTEMINLEPPLIPTHASDLLQNGILREVVRIACLLSMISVCLHTPETILQFPPLNYIIFVNDVLVTIIFIVEAIVFNENSYLRSRWSQFEFFMLVMHIASVGLHAYELISINFPSLKLIYHASFGAIRSPRPFVMIRFIRSLVRFKLPRNRIKQIIKRSSQQIKNVTIFFVFFMTLYAIMGVQLFGHMNYHCVRNGTDSSNVTINDLAIPDTMCSDKDGGGYECPPNMVCMKLDLAAHAEGFYGQFSDFLSSLFTVYLAASQEGWVYVLYDCLDTYPSSIAFFYFVTLIFFLAWLVKNVFIAVITETFAEIRVQFSEMWQSREISTDEGYNQRLEKGAEGWILVELDDYSRTGTKYQMLYTMVTSTIFQISMMFFVLLNAFVNACFIYKHDRSDEYRKEIFYYIEIAFTIFFNLECLIKLLGHGWASYIRRGQHKFEFLLCIGSSLNIIPFFYKRNIFTYFQVFRIVRLIKASPMLEDFVYKIFGPGKKLGGLVLFTGILLIITSAISLQLFCYVPNLKKFITFPVAFTTMFQIITQEGWTDLVVEILRTTNESMVILVAGYFVGYHLLVTLIVLSLFVAVILDNLEMDEELKKVKQLKAREQDAIKPTLPWRLRVFEKFPTAPQMISLKKVPSEFPLPKIRDSFTRQFADNDECGRREDEGGTRGQRVRIRTQHNIRIRHIGEMSSKNILTTMLEESNKNRTLGESTQHIAALGRTISRNGKVNHAVSGGTARNRGLASLKKNQQQQLVEGLKENGDIRMSDTAPKDELKQGEIDFKALQQKRAHAEITRNRIEEEMRENHPMFDRPLFAVGRNSTLRAICFKVAYSRYRPKEIEAQSGKQTQQKYKQLHDLFGLLTYLDWAMVIVTSLSCWSMLFESPWPTNGQNLIFNNPYLQIAEYLFVIAMTFELTVKVLANGFIFTPNAVVKDVGDFMTLFIYVTSVAYLLWMPRQVEMNSLAQLLMIFRAMRPLRIYTLVPHIRRVVVELCRGFREILLVTILLILLMFVFASFGVHIVGGKLAACNDPSITTRENCTGIFQQKLFVTRMDVKGKDDDNLHPSIYVPRVWTNPRNFNFDHIGNAMLALFETLSYKGWNVIRDILYLRHGPWAVLFIHIYVFIGCMIGLTLFVGVVIANYTENRGTALLTVDQRRWHDLKARLKMAQPLHVPPKPPESAKMRCYLYELTMSKRFNKAFAILVVINSAALVVPWNEAEERRRGTFLLILTLLSAVCNVLFTIEIILKMLAFTLRGFCQSRRNCGDLAITVLGLVWIVFHFLFQLPAYMAGGIKQWKKLTYTFGYLVVILRFFTIAGRKSTLKMLMQTVLMSMVRSFFIIAAMFLLVLFYAYAGVVLFGMVKYGQAVSKHVNFRNGREALVVLFRSVTGEDWNDIMHDCMRSPPFCYWSEGVSYYQTDCGNYFGAIIYFCSFYLIITYIVLNLLVAVIMENFSLFYSSEEDALLSYADIRNFQLVWNIVDTEQKRWIPVHRVKFLLRLLKGRLEVEPSKDRLLFRHMCHEMERLHNGEDVSFHDVLNMLSYRSVDIRKSLQLEELLEREELEYIIEEEVAKQTIRTWLEKCLKRIKMKQEGEAIDLHRTSVIAQNFVIGLNQPITTISISESVDSKESLEDEAKKRTKKRRSSIPELMGEAKKFVFGGLTSKRAASGEKQEKTAKERRETMRHVHVSQF
ncbi:hypothetical protein WR25_23917 isoform A [Diploscapter pachys]|uniref:Ion transport domain-containing protein n=1 Tax=Diploscapter pachys TaxID=2018661 RepID=A0A2A2J9U7_9BILA|nr:hypothetical protein WR25_23917 isoform A [Diploscapter pachys]